MVAEVEVISVYLGDYRDDLASLQLAKVACEAYLTSNTDLHGNTSLAA